MCKCSNAVALLQVEDWRARPNPFARASDWIGLDVRAFAPVPLQVGEAAPWRTPCMHVLLRASCGARPGCGGRTLRCSFTRTHCRDMVLTLGLCNVAQGFVGADQAGAYNNMFDGSQPTGAAGMGGADAAPSQAMPYAPGAIQSTFLHPAPGSPGELHFPARWPAQQQARPFSDCQQLTALVVRRGDCFEVTSQSCLQCFSGLKWILLVVESSAHEFCVCNPAAAGAARQPGLDRTPRWWLLRRPPEHRGAAAADG